MTRRLTVAIGADHGGFRMKESLRRALAELGYDVLDCGCFSPDPVDYPDVALDVGRAVAEERAEWGIMIDAAGVGSTMVLNRIRGIRAALCHDLATTVNSRAHNDANVLVLGAKVVHPGEAVRLARIWLSTGFEGGRHERRVAKIRSLEGRGPQVVSQHLGRNRMDTAPGYGENEVRQVTEEVLRRIAARQAATKASKEAAPPPVASGAIPGPHCSRCPPGSTCADPAPPGRPATVLDSGDRFERLQEYGVDRVACCPSYGAVDSRLASMIDHTLLRPEATAREVARLCEEAYCLGCATVCIQPMWVPLAARILQGSPVKVCTVVGFPHGANRAEVKAYETQVAVAQGAREIDMVIPVGALKGGDSDLVRQHLRSVVRAAIPGVVTKVILETAFLTDDEKRIVCRIAREEGAGFVKTSTGFGPAGATVEDVRLMKAEAGTLLGVKAAGGIRDQESARRMLDAGATRIGASASVRIATGGGV